METKIRFIYKLCLHFGLFFCRIIFMYYLLLFIAYNGIGEYFEYIPTQVKSVSINTTRSPALISYSYIANHKEYFGKQEVSIKTATLIDNSQCSVVYNKYFPMLSQIKDVDYKSSKQNECIWKMVISLIGFLFFFLIYKFADHEKWIGVYARGEWGSSKSTKSSDA